MSHTIYHTTGIILGARNTGEANRMLQILTPDLGMITATVQSVRDVKSKHRFGLQNLSYSNIDLVQGRDMWRIIGVDSKQNLSSSYEGFGSLVRSADLLKRMVHGEENLPEIFSLFESSYILVQSKSLQPVHIPAFETIMMLRILYHLGYWSADDEYWLVQDPVTLELLDRITERVPQYMTTIRRSLNMSHL